MKILYFAWLKSRLGTAEEVIDRPASVTDVAGLLDWLSARSPVYAEALAARDVIQVAINQEFASLSDPLADGDEVALFPPVTGG